MMVLDATIVNVALPNIQRELHFTQSNLTWVINGYLITFGGLLLLAGRMGDLVGRKKVFLAGLALFTLASIACGFAPSQGALIGARLIQGIGGAIASSVILAIIVTEFPEQSRAGQSDGPVRVRVRRRRLDRPARRRRADAVAGLALDLLRQRPDRSARVRARLDADRGERGHRPRRRRRRARLGADHAGDDARRVRDREVERLRPVLGSHAARRRRLAGAAGRLPRRSRRGSRTRSCRCASCACGC